MKRFFGFAFVLAFAACDRAELSPPQPRAPTRAGPSPAAATRDDGAALFALHCARCHGDEGRGNGPVAEYLFPKPRDFTRARYKIRSTPTGQLPTDADLLRTIQSGLPGSAMPSFAFLTEAEQRALLGHIKSLAVVVVDGKKKNLFEDPGPGKSIVVGDEPKPELARGRALYAKMACAKCHGESGEGDGPSAPTLVDGEGYPAPPNNFTRGLFKGGATTRDVYTRFATGLTGTPMPATELGEADRWALAQYVKSLVKPDAREVKHESFKTIPGRLAERVPIDPNDALWTDAPATEINLMTLWQRAKAPTHVAVRVLRDAKEFGVCMEWSDPAPDGAMLAPQSFSDGAAVMFSLSKPPTPISMGDREHPCNIWHWRFDRQLDAAAFQDIEARYPNAANDGFYCDPNHYPPRIDQPRHGPQVSAPSLDKTYLTGWGAGNPCSDPLRRTPVQDLNAYGFGTLEAHPEEEQFVEGRGVWISGRWRVVFKRAMEPLGKLDRPFVPGQEVWIAFAVWDGGAGDRDGQKSITFWQTVKLP